MPITANCPGCNRTIAAPDTAAGRKARCPHCGATVDIPAHAGALAALSREAEARAGETEAPIATASPATAVATPLYAEQAPTPPDSGLRAVTPRSNGSTSSTRTSPTTINRLIARSSPYKSLRLLAAVVFGAGAGLAVMVFVAGVVALILVSMAGRPEIGAGVFIGAIALAAGIFLGARILNGMLLLWADMGDRMRQLTQLMEDSLARTKDNGV